MAAPRSMVLVVDDDETTRQGLTALVESWGYRAAEADDGKAALAACDKELPHAIVTDLMMPAMNGLEFVAALGDRVQRIAIIFVTGQAAVDTAVQAIKLGAYDYLPKPLEPQRLRDVLEKALKQVSLAREAGALRLRLVNRQVVSHAQALSTDRSDRRHCSCRADQRRERHRQRIGRPNF